MTRATFALGPEFGYPTQTVEVEVLFKGKYGVSMCRLPPGFKEDDFSDANYAVIDQAGFLIMPICEDWLKYL